MMKHFLIALLCVFAGLLTGLLLSEAVIRPFLPDTETLLPKNGLVIGEQNSPVTRAKPSIPAGQAVFPHPASP